MAQSSTKKVAKKAAAKKAATKKTAVKKKAPAAKKAAAKKTAAKKAPEAEIAEVEAKPKASKKTASKKAVAKKASAKKPAAKKVAAKKKETEDSEVKTKATESKATSKKVAAKKTASKKAAAKKTTSKKAASKKVASKKKADDAEAKTSTPAGPKITVGELEVPDHTKAIRDSSGHYMSEDELNHFSEKLTDWKQALMEEVDRTVGHMKDDATNHPDPNDRATQEEEFSLELRTRDRERKLIKKINEAQKRIEDLEYGYCETCGVEIGVGRLEARPTAELCIDCKTLEEVRERQNA